MNRRAVVLIELGIFLGGKRAFFQMKMLLKPILERGRGLGAAGAVEAIACVMALRTGMIPPTIGLNDPDPECDLDYVPGKGINAELNYVLSNSLGFGGHNACLIFKKV